ncbi:U-scoloptoxin(19)-Sm1a [Chelonus insularis]|uniref:U-scoloptoxin(19)-Sm1a n=1 Tax=Chelonus insularis TaxID=460826 RepID=UPI001589324B|nr:U-scoloptoxin(19)-Sm1a [Chelonus insularis]
MKCWIFLITISFISLCYSSAIENEACPPENCVTSDKCDYKMNTPLECGPSRICCSVLKAESRTHCRHHGGECMSSCNPQLIRDVIDCQAGTHCCVLV